MGDTKQGKRSSRLATAAIVVVGLVAGAGYFAWDWMRAERVELAFLVEPESPAVAILERKSNPEYYDPYLLRVVDARSGAERARLEVGGSRSDHSPRVFGPAGDFAWVTTGEGDIRLVDLARGAIAATHDQLRQRLGSELGGDVRVPTQDNALDPDGRLRVQGANGSYYVLSTDLTIEPLPDREVADYFARCKAGFDALKRTGPLHQPSMRACFELGGRRLGLVQHASAAFGDHAWAATLFDEAGTAIWTLDADAITGDGGWFGHAMPSGESLWVVLVQPGTISATVHTLELDPTTGEVRAQHTVL